MRSRRRRALFRRRTARHEMQLFDNGTVFADHPRPRRDWRFRRSRRSTTKEVFTPVHSPPPSKPMKHRVPSKHRASIDSYVLYMDDHL